MIGVDVGTYNIVVSKRDENGNIKLKKEINAFLEIPLDNRYVFNMLKKSGVALIEREEKAYILGEAATNLAYTLQLELKRPMSLGTLSKEKDGYRILSILLYSLIGEVTSDKELLYYSVPASNKDTNAEFHQKALEDIFKKYKIANKTVSAFPLNEALALIFSELEHKKYSGIGVSLGAGQKNLAVSKWSRCIIQASSVNSGDYIDKCVANATGESIAVVNKDKTKVDLSKSASNAFERAVRIQYELLIEDTIKTIKESIENAGNKVKVDEDGMSLVIGGGVSTIAGFANMFENILNSKKLPIEITDIVVPDDALYSVAKGCLIAAENAA